MNKLPEHTDTANKGAKSCIIALPSLIFLTVVTLLCYLPILLNHAAHSIAVMNPKGSESIHKYAAWDASWNEDQTPDPGNPAELDLRSQAEKDYDAVASASSALGGLAEPCLESFSPASLQLLEDCPWFRKEEVRVAADYWMGDCFFVSVFGLLCALPGVALSAKLRHRPTSAPALPAIWVVGLVFSLIFTANNIMCMLDKFGVILPHWGVLASSMVVVAFLITSLVLFLRMWRAEDN